MIQKFALFLVAAIICFLPCYTTLADDDALSGLVQLLALDDDASFQLSILKGMHDALRGRRDVSMPDGWSDAYGKLSQSPNKDVRDKSLLLALIFKDPQAVASLKRTMMSAAADVDERKQAVSALVESGAANLTDQLFALLADDAMRGPALRALSAYSVGNTPRIIIDLYPSLTDDEKQDAIHTLASRPSYAHALLAAVEAGIIPPRDIHSFTARQIDAFGDDALTETLRRVWGELRQTSADAQQLIAEHQTRLTPKTLEKADLAGGRVLFNRTCAKCHTLYGEGGKIGPDITGGNRSSLFYILENILDPSSSVAKQYQVTTAILADGRILSGLIQPQPNDTVAIQTPTELVIVPQDEIEAQRASTKSMMPDGLLKTLSDDEIRDLVAYLQTTTQIPLPSE